MISENLKLEHEKFVTGYDGSSPVDILLAVSPIIPGAVLATSFTSHRGAITCFSVEFILCVIPLILSFTYLNEATLELNAIMILLFLIRVVQINKYKINITSCVKVNKKQLPLLTSCRAAVNLATIIAILAVDFHIFPRRFVKTEKYGYSLMDVGAACYVFMNAITDNKRKSFARHVVRDYICLVLLGVIRLVSVSASHYQHHVTEYGLHANFFFTLAFIKIACFWVPLIPLLLKVILGICLSFVHQRNLSSGLESWTLSDEPRDNFIAANREWFVSMPGYIAIYIFGSALGEYIFTSKPSVFKLGILAVIPFSSLFIAEIFFQINPSRRLANLSFILWITAFFIILLTFYQVVEKLLLTKPSTCLIFEAINTYPLMYFLLGNVITGLINISCNTLEMSNLYAFVIVNIYVFTLLSIVTMLYFRKVKNKLHNS